MRALLIVIAATLGGIACPGGARRHDSVIGDGHRHEPRGSGEIVEAAGKEGPKR
jgi:hypothetical protein